MRDQSRRQILLFGCAVLLVLVLIALPFITDQYTITLIYTLFIYVGLAQSWNLIGGYTGLVSLGHVAFLGLGAYTVAILINWLHMQFYLALLGGGLLSAMFALLVAFPILRFRGIYFTIGTLVLAEALQIWMINWSLTGGAQGIEFSLSNIPDTNTFYYIGLALALGATALLGLILHTKLGVGLRAIRDNEDAAQNMGVHTFRVKLIAFVLSAFIAGLVGGVHAVYLGTIEPYSIFSINWTITAVNIVIIGGIGTLLGPIIGAIFVVVLSEYLADYPSIHLILLGFLLILVIRFLPAGIWGSLRQWMRDLWRARMFSHEKDNDLPAVKAVRRV